MAKSTTSSRRGVAAKVLPSRKRVRDAIDSGVRSLRGGLLAADENVRRSAEQLAERLIEQIPTKGLHDLVKALEGHLARLKEVLPTTAAQRRGVRDQVTGSLANLRRRAKKVAKKATRRPSARTPG